jgi:ribosomal RNA assembly protein
MKTLISEKIPRIIKNKKRLEKELNVKIENRGKETKINGTPEDEFIAEKVLDALNFGFPYKHALEIKRQGLEYEEINLKDHTKKHNYELIRGRIIGKSGKALKTLSNLSECYIEINENKIAMIGEPINIENAIQAMIQLIQGAKHGNVYKGLEKNQPKPIEDLGLRKEFIKNDPSRT